MGHDKNKMWAANIIVTIITAPIWIVAALVMIIVLPAFWISKSLVR